MFNLPKKKVSLLRILFAVVDSIIFFEPQYIYNNMLTQLWSWSFNKHSHSHMLTVTCVCISLKLHSCSCGNVKSSVHIKNNLVITSAKFPSLLIHLLTYLLRRFEKMCKLNQMLGLTGFTLLYRSASVEKHHT